MSAKKSYIKIWVFLLMVIAFIGIDGMAVVHAQETGQTTQEVLKASSGYGTDCGRTSRNMGCR